MTRARQAATLALTALVLAGALGGLVWGWFAWRTTPPEAPAFSLVSTGYEEGAFGEPLAFTLADYRGETVLVDFMAVACAACRVVTEDVVRPLHDAYPEGLVVLSIDVWAGSLGESREDLVRLQQEENTTWRHALDTEGLLAKYGIIGIPHLAVIDPEGRLVYSQGGIPSRSDVESAVQLAMEGQGSPQAILQVGVVGLSLLAGLAAVFTPCAVGLLPGYVAQLMRATPVPDGTRIHPLKPLQAGVLAAAGAVSLYALMAALLWLAGPFLRSNLLRVGPVMGLALVAVGFGMVAGWDWGRIAPERWRGWSRRPSSFTAFGFAYALVSFGCTGPVFVPILAAAFLQDALTGVLALAAYAASVSIILVLVAALAGTGSLVKPLQAVLARARPIQVVSGLLLVGAGAYLIWFYAKAGLLAL